MICVIIAFCIFFIAVAVSPFLIGEKGYILIAMGNTTIELTVLSAGIMLTLFFIALVLIFKIIKGGISFSFSSWDKMVFAGQRRAIANFNKGLAAYMLEDYQQAETLFAKCAEPSKRKQSAYLLAASASAKLAKNSNTNHYLALLEKETLKLKEVGLESVIVNIKILMDQDSQEANGKARTLIDEYHKHIGHDSRLLSLEIQLCIIEERFEQAIDYLPAARKEKAFTADTVQQWESIAYYGSFNHTIKALDNNALQESWKALSRKIKQREPVLLAYTRVLAENDIIEPLNRLLLPIFKKDPSSDFLKQARTLPISHADELINIVQKQLHKAHKHDHPKWLSCLGHLALASEQYPMAEKAFGSLVKLDAEDVAQLCDRQDMQAYATAYSKQGLYQAADTMWAKASQL